VTALLSPIGDVSSTVLTGVASIVNRRGVLTRGGGLGKDRWIMERAGIWLYQNRRLKLRCEVRDEIQEAFLALAHAWIFLNGLDDSFP
jgi:hypothetical protein